MEKDPMGLDILAYRNLRAVENQDRDCHGQNNPDDVVFDADTITETESAWPGRTEGIEARTVYAYDEKHSFRAGSYTSYQEWRERLALFAYGKPLREVWSTEKDGPFFEVLDFSDCEGVIGPKIAAKLAADAEAFQAKADAEAHPYFRYLYAQWRRAFEMAADNGAIAYG
jgi:hypothetical protein